MSVSSEAQARSPFLQQFQVLWRYPNFGLLWSGQVVSHLGDAFSAIALIWFVQELTGSRAMMGAVNAVVSAMALTGLVAGALVDRWDRRRTMLLSDILRGLVIFMLPVLAFAGRLEIWQVFVVAALMGMLAQLFGPAKQALIPHLVASEDLTSANALSQMAFILLMAAGYALGGAMLAVMTASQLFVLDAATFGVSAITIALIRVSNTGRMPPNHIAGVEGGDPTGVSAPAPATARNTLAGLGADIGAGLRYIGSDKLIATIIPIAILANFVYAPISVLLAAWAKDVVKAGAQGYGLLESSFLVGNLAGTLAASSPATRWRRGRMMPWCIVMMGLPLIGFAAAPNLYADVGMLAVAGFMNGIINIVLLTTFQQRVPNHLMGRFFGTLGALFMVATPLGIAIGGVLGDLLPLSVLFTAMGLLTALIGVGMFRIRVITELE